ncbi:hypothetical protein TH0227_06900 [Helicobacter pylori]|uniref:hypothetical protein n=1 Tax=Helicobacter pylori TaxID=210 RepID=UPI0018848E3C|nr:hypothetical protein [Helicobacter pylori]
MEFDRKPPFDEFDISDKMLDETLSCYSKTLAAYIKKCKSDFGIKAPGDPRYNKQEQVKIKLALARNAGSTSENAKEYSKG